ncbi:MAG: DMT family transporter, partial [Candidatus Yanofskybacteria bacterium]|nr:DMT family transporter [Candidatus Yanofskybacteria bacterium]
MWIFIALIGQFIGGTSALFDKLIIKKLYPNPVGYTFWLGILGIFSFFLLPFGFHLLPPAEMTFAFFAGSVFLLGFLLYFNGLARGQASNVVILLGTFLPISTLIWSRIILGLSLGTYHLGAFILLISGSIVLFLTEPNKFRWRIFVYVAGSAVLIGLSSALAKYVYTASNFATGFVYIKVGGFIMALLFLLIPQFRRKIFKMPRNLVSTRLGYLANRAYAGTGSILVQFSIALGIPPIVDALYNFQLIVVFIGGWLILKEKVRGWALVGKVIAISIIGSGILWLGIGQYLRSNAPNLNRPMTWGVTFSQKFANQMGLEWKQAYEAILGDLGVRRIRLVAYWDDIEPERREFNFSDLD